MSRESIGGDRRNRYREKVDRLDERLEDISRWGRPDSEEIVSRKKDLFALKKAFQETVEAVTDLCAMFLADTGREVADDASNIQKCAGKFYSEDLEGRLLEANGLRNRVVHDYNGFNERKGVESIKEAREVIEEFKKEVEEWIRER
jgi:uncharacterized protein YutE (UPF0331/DUF86 family)